MSEKYLLDTCIWRDFYENRFSKSGKPLGKYATKLFMKIIKSKDMIIFSEALFWELKKDYTLEEINDMLNFLSLANILYKIEITREEYAESKELATKKDIPFVDCLNAIQAKNHNAIMVSQDQHFFQNLSDVIIPVRPEDLN